MAEKKHMAVSLRRLAVLESQPIRTISELKEWQLLRKWVLENELLEEYRNQDYFSQSREITKNALAPKNSSSIFSRFWNFISRK
ncbi:MAG: hypothetical protein NZ730_08120 [Porticoccaceae bacterium]|nr:hypothetical protein [Porticoccaceae bacterium]